MKAPPKKFLQGTIKRNPDGFGFFIPDDPDHPDVYIPRHSMAGVMTSDRVLVVVEPEKGGERFRGEIIQIATRGTQKVVGQFFKLNEKEGILRDEGKGWGQDLRIRMEDSMNAAHGELVAALIIDYPDEKKPFRGRVVELMGSHEDPLNDIKRVTLANQLPHEFSSACLKEAESFPTEVGTRELSGRKDLRPLHFVTIDGATAKDFDDAVYVEMTPHGFTLYVAIADVSHYVSVGSAIDRDAYERGTSVYFPNYVIPMLPEVLSNELCSLKPHVPRLAFVAKMQMDFQGEVIRSEFFEAVIESKARVTYGEAQELIEGNQVENLAHVAADIRRASDLAKILLPKRMREGSLNLEIPETQMVIDASGNPVDVLRSERLFAHRVIEELMLSANVAVAKELASRNIPALYRVHESPNAEAMTLLDKYLKAFGGKIHLQSGKLQKRLTRALDEFEGKPEALVLNILTLRSMAQAKYSPNNLGHFGLGFDFYSHFTSPIRRYPDLIVHRLLKNQIMPKSKYRLMSAEDLNSAAVMLSACEQRSVKAERQLMGIKKARFLQKFLGQEFEGVVSSVVKFGIFVLLRAYEVDGLIRLDDLGPERFEFDEEYLRLVAKRSGHSYSIGDTVKIIVSSVDIEAGQANFTLAPQEGVQIHPPFHKDHSRHNHQADKKKKSAHIPRHKRRQKKSKKTRR